MIERLPRVVLGVRKATSPDEELKIIVFSPAERIYCITYHISSSPYYSEDIHTNYPRMSLKGVITQG